MDETIRRDNATGGGPTVTVGGVVFDLSGGAAEPDDIDDSGLHDPTDEEWTGSEPPEEQAENVVYLCGSAADAETLNARGLAAVCSPGLQDCAAHLNELVGRTVVILPGLLDGEKVAAAPALAALAGKATRTQVLMLPGEYDEGMGVQGWLKAGHSVREFAALTARSRAALEPGPLEPSAEDEWASLAEEGWSPFPLGVLPTSMRDYIQAGGLTPNIRSTICDSVGCWS